MKIQSEEDMTESEGRGYFWFFTGLGVLIFLCLAGISLMLEKGGLC